MAIDFASPMASLVTILKAIPGLENDADGTAYVTVGVPESLSARTSAYVALADVALADRATQLAAVTVGYLVAFGYAVEGDQTAAEAALAAYLAVFVAKMLAPNGRRLGGLQVNGGDVEARLDFALAGTPQYEPHAGQEFRVFPCNVRITMYTTF